MQACQKLYTSEDKEKHLNTCTVNFNKTGLTFITSGLQFECIKHACLCMRKTNTSSCVFIVFVCVRAKLPLGAIRVPHNMAKPGPHRDWTVSTLFPRDQHSQPESRKKRGGEWHRQKVSDRDKERGTGTKREGYWESQRRQRKGNPGGDVMTGWARREVW